MPGLFTLRGSVSRSQYALVGFGLTLVKYLVEALVVWLVVGKVWSPVAYLLPIVSVRSDMLGGAPSWLLWLLALWTLPFLWIGVSWTLRRSVDAGLPAPVALIFFLPILNYLLMLSLCLAPTREQPGPAVRPAPTSGALRSALLGVALGTGIATAMVLIGVVLLRGYGTALFAGTPFIVGAAASWVWNKDGPRSTASSIGVGTLAVLVGCAALFAVALEGIFCILMALPLMIPVAILGALVGQFIASAGPVRGTHAAVMLLALPTLAAFEGAAWTPPEREVVSAVEVDAPPMEVWEQVVSFPDLPPPHRLVFAAGISVPIGATIEGEGVGAVRHCRFTTGDFVEPITAWEPGRRLAFDVVDSPPPMTETSIWNEVYAPHLFDRTFRTVRGEFRLVPLDGGTRTRLEGSTWYTLDMGPQAYWIAWTEAALHGIHARVLEHVKREAER